MHSLSKRPSLPALWPVCAFSICSFVWNIAHAADDAAAVASAPHIRSTNRLPLSFEVNRGQADSRAKFLARGRDVGLFFTDQGAVLALTQPAHRDDHRLPGAQLQRDAAIPQSRSSLALRYQFAGANRHPKIEALDPLPGHSNYFIGNDPKQWRTDIAQYRRVRYHDVYPGVDVVYYGKDGQLEFDVEAAAGVDLTQVRLRVGGADSLALDDEGNLQLHTAFGVLTQRKPVVYQMIDGERRELNGEYVLRDLRRDKTAHEVAFRVADYDRRYALVLDPTLIFAKLVGGTGADDGNGVAVDASGNSYVTGYTNSTGFPTTVGAYQTTHFGQDAFISKISADGTTLIYSTLIGGNSTDEANAIAVDSNGNAYITGRTLSANFPLKNALQSTLATSDAAFVTSLNAAGNGLNYSTYLGGQTAFDGSTIGYGIAVDAAGNAYVGGFTYGSTIPVSVGAFQTTYAGGGDAFVVKIGPTGSLGYGTYLGGTAYDEARAIAVDNEGDAYIAGGTGSTSFNGVVPNTIGPGTIWIAELNPAGTGLVYVSKIGSSDGSEEALGIAVDGGHQVYFSAYSNGTDLPPTAPPQHAGVFEAYIGHLDDSGTVLYDFTWYGATDGTQDYGYAINLDEARQSLYVGGKLQSFSGADSLGNAPSINPVPGLDCAGSCVGATGAFLLQYTINPLTLASATRVSGGSGTNAIFNAVAHDPVSGHVAAVGTTDGNPPTTVASNAIESRPAPAGASVSTNAGGDDFVEALVDYGNTLHVVVGKYFKPPELRNDQEADLVFVVTNPSEFAALTSLILGDLLPACLELVPISPTLSPPQCLRPQTTQFANGQFDIDINPAAIPLPPNTTCKITFKVKAKNGFVGNCTNITNTGNGQFEGGSNSLIRPVTATLEVTAALKKTLKAPARPSGPAIAIITSAGSMSDGANWVGGVAPVDGDDVVFPSGVTQSVWTNDLPAVQRLNLVTLSGTGYNLGGGTFNLLAGVYNSGASNTFSAPIRASLPISLTSDPVGAVLNLSGSMDPNGQFIALEGAGNTFVSAPIIGTGDVGVGGPGAVTLSVSPGFTGNLNVAGGVLYANVSVSQPISVFRAGLLRGTGPFGAVTVDDSGDVFPGTSATPAALSIASLTINGGFIELAFAANNASYSSVNASGAVQLNGGTLKLDLATQPTVGTTFSSLITAPGTITGCFGQATATPPNVFVKPQCTANAVSAIVVAVDGIFRNGFN